MFKDIKSIALITLSISLFMACNSKKVVISKTHVKKYVYAESMQSTEIKIFLEKHDPAIEFTSLIYNHKKVPVQVSDNDERLVVKGIIQHGDKLIQREENTVDEPNQLQFIENGKHKYVLLDNIEFLPTSLNPIP